MGARLARVASGVLAGVIAGPAAGLALVVARSAWSAARRSAARRYQAALRGAAEDVLAALATELDAGGAPDEALRTALASVGDLPAPPGRRRGRTRRAGRRTRRRTRLGRQNRLGPRGGPAEQAGIDLALLRERLPGTDDPARLLIRCEASALRQLATAYRVCRLAGVRLAPVATMLADTARADAVRADELASALAGPRSSGRLVAGLPLLGLVLGALVGAAPVAVLLADRIGTACLTAGVLLDLAGLRWLRRISDGVEARVPPVCAPPLRAPRGAAGTGGRAAREYRRRLLADLPLALDLVAACLRSGASTQVALEIVGVATGGAAGAELRAAGRALRAGLPADEACARLLAAGTAPRALDRLAAWRPRSRRTPDAASGISGTRGRVASGSGRRETRVVTATAAAIGRTEASGAKLAATLTRIGERARQEAHASTIAAARRAGVVAVAPLGLCFLPAFLLLGVVPIVVGSAPDLGPALVPSPAPR